MSRIRELDGLRAIAILMVIGCHYKAYVVLTAGVSEWGWLGVDVFFVLSGYLITTILLGLRSKRRPYKTFYARRAVRIFPSYFGVTLAVVLLAVARHNRYVLSIRTLLSQLLFLQAAPGTKTVLDIVSHLRWYLKHLPGLLQYAQNLPDVHLSALTPGLFAVFVTYWSLSIEEYFYLLWAPIMLRLPRRWIVLIGVLIVIIEIFIRWAADTPSIYFNLFAHFDSLIYGAFLAVILEYWRRIGVPSWAPQALLSVFSVCAVLDSVALYLLRPVLGCELRASPLILALGLPLFCIGSACIIGLLVLRGGTDWWFARVLRAAPLQYIGTISYTMYLTHILIALFVLKAASMLHFADRFLLLQALFATGITILISHASWHYIEKPALRWKDRRFSSGPHPSEPALN